MSARRLLVGIDFGTTGSRPREGRTMRTLMTIALLGASLSLTTVQASEPSCGRAGALEFVCGIKNAEDLVLVPGTLWIIASGFAAGTGITLIDSRDGTHSMLYPGDNPRASHDARFAACPAPPAPAQWFTHGLNLRPGTNGHSTLYAVGHGAREAIEVFDVDATGAQPALTWQGCVPMPEGLSANSVASFADGSLVATVLLMPGKTFPDIFARKTTGAVFTSLPDMRGFELIRGSELSGNNGIEVSADGREIFVASSGLKTIVAFSHTNPTQQLRTTRPLPFTPDNVHRGLDGRLLTAGMKDDEPACGGTPPPTEDFPHFSTCPRGFIAMAIDPATMQETLVADGPTNPAFSNATMVLLVGKRFWIGTFSGDRVGYGVLH
jgi:hypothetical protein